MFWGPEATKPERSPGTLDRFDREWNATTRSGSVPAEAAAARIPGGGAPR